MAEFNPEHIHIGRALKTHREMLHVDDAALAKALGEAGYVGFRFAEAAVIPSIRVIRWYHGGVLTAFKQRPGGSTVSMGLREQWWATEADSALCRAAYDRHPRSRWWWAPRKTERGAGAYCYVCDTLIHPYDVGHDVTHNARLAVMEHRAAHITPGVSAPGPNRAGRTR
jgi:hypothetical protein